MYHLRKHGDSPVDVESLLALKAQKPGTIVHGRPVWQDGPEGRRLLIFDEQTKSFMTQADFKNLQRARALQRQAGYPKGRRKHHRRIQGIWISPS